MESDILNFLDLAHFMI